MADFRTNLSGPQGAGAQVVAPVTEQQVPDNGIKLLDGIVDIFAKGLVADNKAQAQARKNAIVGEYINNEKVYSDALVTGQWNAGQVGIASRANFTKMLAAYPELTTELSEAKKSIYDATEIGEAQKKVDAQEKMRQADRDRASAAGYTFYDGMSAEAEQMAVNSYKTTTRINSEFEDTTRRSAEQRAQAAEGRAVDTNQRTVQDYADKENAVKGLLEIADKNFDSLNAVGKDLMNNPNMTFEQKQIVYNDNIKRIRTGMLAISAKDPALAAPWMKLTDEMEETYLKLIDPKPKAAGEAALLKAQYDAQQYKQKLLITADPKARAAVALSDLFGNNPTLIQYGNSPVIMGLLSQYGLGPEGNAGKQVTPVVGTENEGPALKTLKGALNLIQNGKAQGDKNKTNTEAVNSVNEVLKQTGAMQNGVSPAMLKQLSSFYGSPEFGKLAAEGKLDMPSVQNAKRVFQVSYEPAVRDAVIARLDENITRSPGRDGGARGQPVQKVLNTVDIKFSGAGVQFVDKPGSSQTIGSSFTRNGLNEAANGLNTLIHIGAHMEGTTDYAKYWEANKHFLLPNVFPDPVKLKVGQTIKAKNGKSYKYTGGDFNDIASSYVEVPSATGE